MQGSVDLVVADLRWGTVQGTIRGAGASRIGNTGQNMALSAGMIFRWTKQNGSLNPYALTWVALRASTGATQPVVTTPTSANITATTATLGGTLASTGGSTITQRGVVYCRCADPVIGGNGVTTVDGTVNDTTGPFTVSASSLARLDAVHVQGVRHQRRSARPTPPPRTSRPPRRRIRPPTANAGGPYSVTEGVAADPQRVRHRCRQRPADLLVGRQRRRHVRRRDRREPHADRRRSATRSASTTGRRRSTSACGSPTARTRRPPMPPP